MPGANQRKKCMSCRNHPGKCPHCKGTGDEPAVKAKVPCHVCNGSGLCPACGGTGWA